MALGQWFPLQSKKEFHFHCQKWRLYMVRRPFSKPIHAKGRDDAMMLWMDAQYEELKKRCNPTEECTSAADRGA